MPIPPIQRIGFPHRPDPQIPGVCLQRMAEDRAVQTPVHHRQGPQSGKQCGQLVRSAVGENHGNEFEQKGAKVTVKCWKIDAKPLRSGFPLAPLRSMAPFCSNTLQSAPLIP